MPNLAAKNGSVGGSGGGGIGGGHHGVYLHSQSQPSSQYRIKEYPLYVEGSSNGVVVRSLESDQEGHYSVKAQFKTSSSYTAGGLYKEAWGGEEGGEGSGRLTPSRSQIVRTPSLGREGGGGGGRAAVSEELRCWYQRSSGSLKERSHSHSGSTSSETGSQQGTLGHGRGSRVGSLAKGSPGMLSIIFIKLHISVSTDHQLFPITEKKSIQFFSALLLRTSKHDMIYNKDSSTNYDLFPIPLLQFKKRFRVRPNLF